MKCSSVVLEQRGVGMNAIDRLTRALEKEAASKGRKPVNGTWVFWLAGDDEAREVLGTEVPRKTAVWCGEVLTEEC